MAKHEAKQSTFMSGVVEKREKVPRDTLPREDAPVQEDLKMEKKERLLGNWLDTNFVNKGTKKAYYFGICKYLSTIYPNMNIPTRETMLKIKSEERHKYAVHRNNIIDSYVTQYVEDTDRDFLTDYKACIHQLVKQEYAPITINTTMGHVKKFFDRMDPERYAIDNRDLDDIRASLLPAPVTMTKDEIPTKDELKQILFHLSAKYRALIMLLISTGCRIGGALQLKMSDLNVDAERPYAELRPQYTKGGVGGRRIWFTLETRDALRGWLKIKDSYLKKSGEYFDKTMVFDISYRSVLASYHRALTKAGLDQRDPNTKNRTRKYHLHTLRKFFRTQMGDAGMPDMITHALMGHKAYLSEAYDRPRQLAETYAKYMDAVTIFEKDIEAETREAYEKAKLESQIMVDEGTKVHLILTMLGKDLGIDQEMETIPLLTEITYRVSKLQEQLERCSPT